MVDQFELNVNSCINAYDNFMKNPTKEMKEKLRKIYESVPESDRRFMLSDQDVKDIPIRMILYEKNELEKWSHKILFKKLNESLPTINVPELKEIKL